MWGVPLITPVRLPIVQFVPVSSVTRINTKYILYLVYTALHQKNFFAACRKPLSTLLHSGSGKSFCFCLSLGLKVLSGVAWRRLWQVIEIAICCWRRCCCCCCKSRWLWRVLTMRALHTLRRCRVAKVNMYLDKCRLSLPKVLQCRHSFSLSFSPCLSLSLLALQLPAAHAINSFNWNCCRYPPNW